MKLLNTALLALVLAHPGLPCSVLSHEAIVDAAWATKLEPFLKEKFPEASPQELKAAHGFAYGGSIIQDLGYYPHGNKHFSDLTHYIRTGDFVIALLTEAKTLNEVAFALGALSHYASDSDVHRFATNPGEAILYPRLARKFGTAITYEQDPAAHLKTEFGFDVLEVAEGNFAPEAYHDFIGFGVATPLLASALKETYGIELKNLFHDVERSVNSYRRAVSKTIPEATRIAWAEREKDIKRKRPGITRSKFVYLMSRSSYEREWGVEYDRPTLKDRIAARLIKLLPPIGPLRALRFRMPTEQVEELFAKSFAKSIAEYGGQVDEARARRLRLPNVNYDLGEVVKPGTYALQDEAYCFWLDELAKEKYKDISPEVRATLLDYLQATPDLRVKKGHSPELRISAELKQLKSFTN